MTVVGMAPAPATMPAMRAANLPFALSSTASSEPDRRHDDFRRAVRVHAGA